MTNYEKLFREVDILVKSRDRIGNGGYISIKGTESVTIKSFTGTKLIFKVLCVLKIDRNLLSVGQLLEKMCLVINANGQNYLKLRYIGQRFSLNLLKEK